VPLGPLRPYLCGVADIADPDLISSERDVLLRYLNRMRAAVVGAPESLSDGQVRAPGVPSGTNLLGLIQHLTGVEQHWFRLVFLGEDLVCNGTTVD
jgi:Protein of unknown function (DUF664)